MRKDRFNYFNLKVNEAQRIFLTSLSLSNLAKSSFNVLTSSGALTVELKAVKPTMSAKRMLKKVVKVLKNEPTKF